MTSEKRQNEQKRKPKHNQKFPECPDVNAEYGSCIMQCNEPCSWGLRRWAEYKQTGK